MSRELRAVLCIDDCTPEACAVQLGKDGTPFVFVVLNSQLDVYAHDPAALRRLAEAATTAADALDAALATAPVERLYHEIACPSLTKTGPCSCTPVIVADAPVQDVAL